MDLLPGHGLTRRCSRLCPRGLGTVAAQFVVKEQSANMPSEGEANDLAWPSLRRSRSEPYDRCE